MTWLFAAFAMFGGALLLPMLLGGLDGGDLDLDAGDLELGDLDAGNLDIGNIDIADIDIADIDVADVAIDGGFDAGDLGEALGDLIGGLISLRSFVMFSAFFGTAGLVLTGLSYPAAVGFPTAFVIGLFAAVVNSALNGFLVRSQVTSHISNQTLEGRPGQVVLPIAFGRKGKVRVDLAGQPHFIVAKSYDDRSADLMNVGESVVVVQIEQGTALVAPAAELA